MKMPDGVEEMLRLRACGWGTKRIAREFGCSHHTVKHYIAASLASSSGHVRFRVRSRHIARLCAPRRWLATVRFEAPPGRQWQIDFGERFVEIGGAKTKDFVFVATLGHSRLRHVRAFRSES
jgi:transposase